MLQRFALLLACLAGGLGACGKLNSLQPGMYRSAIQLGGGEIPMELRIDRHDSQFQLWVVEGDLQSQATEFSVSDSQLRAVLPYQLGTLQARFDRNGLTGELRLTPLVGKPLSFPLTAKRNENYRFWKDAVTDNADVSGNWRLQLTAAPVLMSLTQSRDVVDGRLQLQDGSCDVIGQVRNDDVYLAAYCKAQLWLFHGTVNKSGELEGEVWGNLDSSQRWHARHTDDIVQPPEDQSRQVTLPWAVPTR